MSGLSVTLSQDAPIPLDAAFSCAPGEMLALFGPSGSGKSTILRALAGLDRPQAGCVEADGTIWFDSVAGRFLPAHARRVGLVFQSYALFPHMTALANVTAALGHLPANERPERARRLLTQMHLEGLEARRPAHLSGGQRQRVALARAMAREPQALLLDEPFSAVDKMTREALYRELALIRRRLAAPTLLVTHDLEEARLLADRLCLLDAGRVLQQGRPQEVAAAPVSATAARLLGHRNVLSARVAAADGKTIRLDWGGLEIQARSGLSVRSGETVDWLVPPTAITPDAQASPPRENRLQGRVHEQIVLGETAFLTLAPDHAPETSLSIQLPAAHAAALSLETGAALTCSFPPDSLHVMRRAG